MPSAAQREAKAAFAGLIGRLREAAGHASAREFYRAGGGRAFFLCTYEQYLNVERGRSAPSPRLVEKIAVALRVWLSEESSRRFFMGYLRLLLGSEDLVAMVSQAVGATREGKGVTPLRQALQRTIESERVQVTPEQAEAMYADPVSYWLSAVFCNDAWAWSVPELAELLGYGEAAVRRSVDRYVKVGFVIPSKDGRRFRCFADGRLLLLPRRTPHSEPEKWARLSDRLIEAMTRRRGGREMRQTLFLRASSPALSQYYPYLAQTVLGAGIYEADERGPDTALYVVSASVRRLFRF